MNKKIINSIEIRHGINLLNEVEYVDFKLNNIIINTTSVIQQYINNLSKVVKNEIDQFYIKYDINDEIKLYYDSEYRTELNEHIHISDLGEFMIASKSYVYNEYIWEFYIRDRFGNPISIIEFRKDNFLYKYLDAIVEYCNEVGNQFLL